MKIEDRKCSHEHFKYCTTGASPIVFVFERSRFVTPTKVHLEDYRRRKTIVEVNGGHMNKAEYECAGENPVFDLRDVKKMIAAVFHDNPDLTLDMHWNGHGCYAFSVGACLK